MRALDLSGRTALVTGAGAGVGERMARALAQAGAEVIVTDVRTDAGHEVARDLGNGAAFVPLDVTADVQWNHAVEVALDLTGRLDVIVNNAAVEPAQMRSRLSMSAIRAILEVNVVGTALGIRHGLRAMCPGGIAGSGGAIVSVATTAAHIPVPGKALGSATTAAVARLTGAGAAESGTRGCGVRVNYLYSGTGGAESWAHEHREPALRRRWLTPVGRPRDHLSELAGAVVYLASDAARFVSGTGLAIHHTAPSWADGEWTG